jgi:ribose transport system ATP-binding protein
MAVARPDEGNGGPPRPAVPARVEIRQLSKSFPGTQALDRVDLDIAGGEIHALVGGNGSGKSTLIKILTGVYQGDEGGTIRVGDQIVDSAETTPEGARSMGIHAVHQDLGIFPGLSVAENMALGYRYETGPGARVRWRAQRRRARQLIERFEIDARPNTPMSSLRQAARTQVAIARALQVEDEEGSAGLLILDEPTASLPTHEVDLLLAMLRKYAAEGQSILHVSHRLDEVLGLADRVTVLRDGAKVGTWDAGDLDENELIGLIVGRQLDRVFPEMPKVAAAEPLLKVEKLNAGPLRDVSLEVRPGEVLGIAGLLGSGRSELLRAIFGDLRSESGEVVLGGERLRLTRPADGMGFGIAYVPENRAADAAFLDLPVAANISAANISDYWRGGHMANRKMRSDARGLMDEFLVKAAGDDAPLATLSGGNQQKVIVARWLRRKPRLLLLDEPTQGVDVGARAEIYGLVRNAVDEGAAAIVVASDFEELAHVSDRVLILREGRITAEATKQGMTAETLTQAAYAKGPSPEQSKAKETSKR